MRILPVWRSLRDAPPPPAAVEVSASGVAAAAIEIRAGQPALVAEAWAPLEAGALVPSLVDHNLRDRAAVAAAVGRVLAELGRPRRIGLILPDPVAKVSLIRLAQVPARAQERDDVLRWQVRKAAPFPIDEAQISHAEGAHSTEGQEFIVTLARRAVVREYEEACEAAGAHAGLVDLCTFSVINTVLAGEGATAEDWLLVNVAPDYASIAILRGRQPIFFRSRGAEAEGTLVDLVHQTAMYYEDRLQGGGFQRVMLCSPSPVRASHPDIEAIRRSVEDRLGASVQMVDARAAVSLAGRREAGPAQNRLVPLVGLLRRGQDVAV